MGLDFCRALGLLYMCYIWAEVGFWSAGYPFVMDEQVVIDKWKELWLD